MYSLDLAVVGVTLKKKWHCLQKSDLTLALGKGSRAADKAVAMVMKEIPREESAEEKPLLTMTSQLVNEQQESRPLLSPSIDDFLCETKSEAIARPVTSNTAVLTTGLDLLDLSEPVSQTQTKAKKLEASSKTSSLKKKADGSDLISADAEQRGQPVRGPETSSLDLDIQTQLEKWDDVKFHGDRNSKGHPMAERKSCSSRTGSKELLWSSEHRSQPELSGGKSALNSESASELELVPPAQARLTKEQRWGSALLSRNHSLEEEFERAKAAVEVTFFFFLLFFCFMFLENEICYQRNFDLPPEVINRCQFLNQFCDRLAIYLEPWSERSESHLGSMMNPCYTFAMPL
uniref:Peroxisomal biosis factor 5 like n=1 Tax=Canis lupus familiaris TaxID=9615 RepID=A0A8P0NZG8_CANLF